MNKSKKNDLNKYFLFFLIAGNIGFWVFSVITRGKWITNYFINDINDTAMDFFNMLSNMKYTDPYSQNANYPAMCFLILKVLFRIIPIDVVEGDGFYYRNLMYSQLVYILYTLILLIIIWELIKYSYQGSKKEKVFFSIAICFSGPVLYAIERGNFILACFTFLLVFVLFYDSEKKIYRYGAYCALAVAASIKMYPALFGILIIYKRRHTETIHALLLGILTFFLPFFAFNGLDSLFDMFQGITISSALQGNQGMGYNFSFFNLVKIFIALKGDCILDVSQRILIIPILICTYIFITSKELWKKMYALSLACVWLPCFSYTYTLLLFILPLVFLLRDKKEIFDIWGYIYRFLFLFILIPLGLPTLEFLELAYVKFPLSMSTAIVNIDICLLTCMIIVDNLMKGVIKKTCYK